MSKIQTLANSVKQTYCTKTHEMSNNAKKNLFTNCPYLGSVRIYIWEYLINSNLEWTNFRAWH